MLTQSSKQGRRNFELNSPLTLENTNLRSVHLISMQESLLMQIGTGRKAYVSKISFEVN